MGMFWIVIAILPFLIICWFLLSPLELQIDTRVPRASVQWISIGRAVLVYEKEEWFLKVKILFFNKEWSLLKLLFADRKKKKPVKVIQRRKSKAKGISLTRFFKLFSTFRVIQWHITIDSGDSIKNGLFYPLIFSPYTRQHVYINFMDENYLVITIRNVPWRILYAWIK